jgi:hypothetical protein
LLAPLNKSLGTAMRRRYLVLICALLLMVHSPNSLGGGSGHFDGQDALRLLYGSGVWRSDELKSYFQGQSHGYVSLAFEASYIERDQDKHVVLLRITPRPAEQYDCHACTPLIGGGVFRWSGTKWVVESSSRIIGWGNPFGETFTVVEIGPDQHGILDSIADAFQGYETRSIRLIVPYKGAFRSALTIGFSERPGAGACENRSTAEQYADIRFRRADSELFEVDTKLQFNHGSCAKLSVRKQIRRYRFSGGQYRMLQ